MGNETLQQRRDRVAAAQRQQELLQNQQNNQRAEEERRRQLDLMQKEEQIQSARNEATRLIEADPRYQKLLAIYDDNVVAILGDFLEEKRPKPDRVIVGYDKKKIITGYSGLFRKTPVYKEVQGNPIYEQVPNEEEIEITKYTGLTAINFVKSFDTESFRMRYLNNGILQQSGKEKIVQDYYLFLEQYRKLRKLAESSENSQRSHEKEARRFSGKPEVAGIFQHYLNEAERSESSNHRALAEIRDLRKSFQITEGELPSPEMTLEFNAFDRTIELSSYIAQNGTEYSVTYIWNNEKVLFAVKDIADLNDLLDSLLVEAK